MGKGKKKQKTKIKKITVIKQTHSYYITLLMFFWGGFDDRDNLSVKKIKTQ